MRSRAANLGIFGTSLIGAGSSSIGKRKQSLVSKDQSVARRHVGLLLLEEREILWQEGLHLAGDMSSRA